MYVTITLTATGHRVAYGPYPTPPAPTDPAAVTAMLCPPAAADRITGILDPACQMAEASADLAGSKPYRPSVHTVDDLNAPTVAVCVHPALRHLFAVGVFTGPDRAEQWWQARTNAFGERGFGCHLITLITPEATDETQSGGEA
jgi:hypothetical protein